MCKQTTFAGVLGLLVVALLAGGCRDAFGPERRGFGAPEFAVAGPGIALDQHNGTFGASGTRILKGFNPANPHLGDAIVATFFWRGSTNIITSVGDHLTDGTPVGNTYAFVEYVTAGGISMATYVATNVQNFPDPIPNQNQDKILVVQANLSSPVADAGITISAYTGVSGVTVQALGAHRSASGAGSTTTTASPGPIAIGAGALAYGVTLSDGVVPLTPPAGFANVTTLSDASMKADGRHVVQANESSVEPQWTWSFNSQSTWLATVLVLNPAPSQPLALDQLTGTLAENGTSLSQGFNPTNPHLGDAIIATFFWLGSTNIITSVTDQLSDGSPVGNRYALVEYVTAGGISMATYVATNVQNFPDPNPASEQALVVQATLSSVADGGVVLSAFGGVTPVYVQALGAHRSASGSGSSTATAAPGAIPVSAGALAYGVTMSNGVVGIKGPAAFANITTMSDASMKGDGEYAVQAGAGSVDPQWTWYFDSSSTWLATVIALNAR
jgi:hypothetical protein